MRVSIKQFLSTIQGTIIDTHRTWGNRLYVVVACDDKKIRMVDSQKVTVLPC